MRARRYGHLDKNHTEIANALRKAGYSVGETSASAGFVDLVVSSNEFTCLMEIKTQDERAMFYLSQLKTIAEWKGNVAFASTPEQAIEIMQKRKCLTPIQKEKILQFYYRKSLVLQGKNPLVTVKHFEKEVGL